MHRWVAALAVLAFVAPATAWADASPPPIFRSDFEKSCVSADDWRISKLLKEDVRADRIRCIDDPAGGGHRVLAVTVKPGDAYDPSPGDKPTERAEIQVRRELVRFDTTTWYSFRFRVESPWARGKNRTVIHQIKQNIDERYGKGDGGEEICDAANPLFKLEVDSDGTTPIFRAKVTGTDSCGADVGKATICGDWPVAADQWHQVNVVIRPSQKTGDSFLQLWLDGQACPTYRGILGYPRYGRVEDGRPVIDAQPRFGIYRDALPDWSQTILFDDIAFWTTAPDGAAGWTGIDPQQAK